MPERSTAMACITLTRGDKTEELFAFYNNFYGNEEPACIVKEESGENDITDSLRRIIENGDDFVIRDWYEKEYNRYQGIDDSLVRSFTKQFALKVVSPENWMTSVESLRLSICERLSRIFFYKTDQGIETVKLTKPYYPFKNQEAVPEDQLQFVNVMSLIPGFYKNPDELFLYRKLKKYSNLKPSIYPTKIFGQDIFAIEMHIADLINIYKVLLSEMGLLRSVMGTSYEKSREQIHAEKALRAMARNFWHSERVIDAYNLTQIAIVDWMRCEAGERKKIEEYLVLLYISCCEDCTLFRPSAKPEALMSSKYDAKIRLKIFNNLSKLQFIEWCMKRIVNRAHDNKWHGLQRVVDMIKVAAA